MSFLDFFKNLFKEEKSEERVNFSEIDSWIENKKKHIEEREEEIFSVLKTKIDNFEKDLREKIEELKKFDVDKKRDKARLKTLTKEGKEKYIRDVEKFIDDLNNIERRNFSAMAERMTDLFNNFSKRSRKNYEKATILIGKEVGGIRDEIRRLSRELRYTFNDNKKISILSRKTSIVGSKLKKMREINEQIKKREKEISKLKKETNNKEQEIENISEGVEKVKKSKRHRARVKKKENIKKLTGQLRNKIFNLKKKIDFKKLGDFYHSFEDKIKTVKSLKKNFKEEFDKNSPELIELVKEANMMTSEISKRLRIIKEKRQKVKKKKAELENSTDKVAELKSEKKDIEKTLEELKDKISREEKRTDKKLKKKREIKENIVKELEEIGVKVIENKID